MVPTLLDLFQPGKTMGAEPALASKEKSFFFKTFNLDNKC